MDGAQNILTEDFCILDGEHFFVRCVLPLPIPEPTDTQFRYGVWATLSKTNFDLYLRTFDSMQVELGPLFGWFSNRLKGYPDTTNLKCQIRPQDKRNGPAIELQPSEHPLSLEQRNGITLDRLLEIYALNGHDLHSTFEQ